MSVAAVQVDLTMVLSAIALMLMLCVGVSIAYIPPTRVCLRCGRDVAQTRRRCRRCGYEFE